MRRRNRPSVADLNDAALAIFPQLLEQWLPGGEFRGQHYVAFNPTRTDRNLGSFRIDTQSGRWRDHAINAYGRDPISLLAYIRCCGDYQQAIKTLAAEPLVRAALASGLTASATAKPANVAKSAALFELPLQMYQQGVQISDTPAEAYLIARGLLQTDAWGVLRASRQRHPSRRRVWTLMAPFTNPDGAMVGLHRTYLEADGTKLATEPVRMTLGSVRGCAIRLGQPKQSLIVCEGLEDGLTLFQELDDHPVWVAGGSSLMSEMAIPNEVRSLTIAADNDTAGHAAAQRAAERHSHGGREVRIMRPSEQFKDFNDELRGVGHVA